MFDFIKGKARSTKTYEFKKRKGVGGDSFKQIYICEFKCICFMIQEEVNRTHIVKPLQFLPVLYGGVTFFRPVLKFCPIFYACL